MARLPQPGSDSGTWGDILNEFLATVHKSDGTLKDNSVTSAAIAPNAVDASVVKDGVVSEVKLDAALQAKVNGIGGGGALTLAGDVSGVSNATTVDKVKGVAVSGTPSSGQVLTASGATTASWQSPASAPVTSVAGKTGAVSLVKADVGLGNVDNTADVSKPISTATQTALNAKADTATTYSKTEVDNALATKAATSHTHTLDNLSDVTASGATDGQSLVYNAGTWGPGTVGSGGSVVDATSSVKGVVQLTGDLGGTAASPAVTGLQGTTVTATAPNNGQVLTYNGATAVWSTPSGGGGSAMNVVSKNANYTAVAGDYILLDLSGGPITITTPAPANGAVFSVKKIDASANNVTVTPSSGNIDGYLVNFSFSVTDRGISQDFMSNGTNWYLV